MKHSLINKKIFNKIFNILETLYLEILIRDKLLEGKETKVEDCINENDIELL